jgi:hypothetical protein
MEREEVVEALVAKYKDILEEKDDEELLGNTLEKLREETVEAMVESYQESLDEMDDEELLGEKAERNEGSRHRRVAGQLPGQARRHDRRRTGEGMMTASQPKQVGTINGRVITEVSTEWSDLISSVTVDALTVPDGASQGIRDRLRHHQKQLQVAFEQRLRELPDHELVPHGNSWTERAKRNEGERRTNQVQQAFRQQHRAKRLPGLKRLLTEMQNAGDESATKLVEQMISEREARQVQQAQMAEEAKRRAAFLDSERVRLSAMTFDELLRVKTNDDEVENIVSDLIIPQCTTVNQIAEQVVLSKNTVRSYLDELGIAPCFTRHYTTGHGDWRKDVTAHFYRPDVIPAIQAEIDRRGQIRQTKRVQTRERREEQRAWDAWEKKSGLRKTQMKNSRMCRPPC